MSSHRRQIKEAKRAEKDLNREIRKALLGNLIVGEDGRLTPGGNFRITLAGSADGAFGTRLFGIASRTRTYRLSGINRTQAVYRATEAMKEIGRGLAFASVPDGAVCLLRHVFFRPVVLIFEANEDDEPMLSAYCGRDIFTISSMYRAMRQFDKHLPAGLESVDQIKRAEKKAKRRAKREQKKE